ncbi:phage baseplate assembly protein V [Photorhabdus noenieputensis]|uniref:phage baseplate assembly protein V n=1 Tax=Photorhabdus noenieputensis TaxID=1208607 RepID=UPI001BD22C2E|nr:phage baseplate assembly protein V [Photorhabdus noenieputensis]MBS9436793.1 phage baseplate assembly protein V [Photorhabdus noenieputensis]MCK3669567.1 phage baseplate assembly protein V [Photorhabdus noenieputensis]
MDTQLTELLRLLRNLIRTGVVTEVDHARGMCRVATGNLETDWRPWLTMRAGHSRTWWSPSVSEQVLLLSVGGELTTSFVLPAIYSDQFPAPSASSEAVHIAFPDGAVMEYEPLSGALKVTGIKTAKVQALYSIALEATNIELKAHNEIKLKANNEIKLESYNEIKLESYNEIKLDAKNKIDLKALNKIGLDAKKELELKSHEVKCEAEEKIELKASELTLKGNTKLEGNVENTGGKLSSNGVTLHSHQHTGVMAGGATTGGPV